MIPKNPKPAIDDPKRAKIERELNALSDEEINRDIGRSKAMARHPYATTADCEELRARILVAREILVKRFRAQLDKLPST